MHRKLSGIHITCLLLSGASILGLTRCHAPREARESAPNVLLLTVSGVEAGDLSLGGNPSGYTPFLDRFSRDCVLFPDVLSESVALPSDLATVLTGTSPATHGLHRDLGDDREKLTRHFPTIGRILGKQGYYCAGILEEPDVNPLVFDLDQGIVITHIVESGRIPEALEKVRVSATGQPCFLWVHISAVAGKRTPLDLDRSAAHLRAGLDSNFNGRSWVLAFVVNAATSPGIKTRTLSRKLTSVLMGFGTVSANRDSVDLRKCRTGDVAPTLLALAGLPGEAPGRRFEGINLLGPSDPRPKPGRGFGKETSDRRLLCEDYGPLVTDGEAPVFAAVEGSWKYVWQPWGTRPDRLCNLEADPLELVNLSNNPELTLIQERFTRFLRQAPDWYSFPRK